MSLFFSWVFDNALALSILVPPMIGIAWMALTRAFPTRASVKSTVDEIHSRIDGHGERIGKVELAVTGLATRDDISRVLLALERQDGERRVLAQQIDGVGEKLRQIEKSADLITEHLLNGRGS